MAGQPSTILSGDARFAGGVGVVVSVEIDTPSMKILDCELHPPSRLEEKLLREIFVGRLLPGDFEQALEEFKERYPSERHRAVVAALRNALKALPPMLAPETGSS